MGRKKISIVPIAEDRNRQVTLNKRKQGLMKKAYELSVLCNCDIALIIFDSTGKHYQYSNRNIGEVLERFVDSGPAQETQTNDSLKQKFADQRKIAAEAGPSMGPHLGPHALPNEAALGVVPGPAAGTRPKVPLSINIPNSGNQNFPPGTRPKVGPTVQQLPSLGSAINMMDPSMIGMHPLPSLNFSSNFAGMFSMPPSPLSSVVHTSKAGDLFVPNLAQQSSQKFQLQRQNSASGTPTLQGSFALGSPFPGMMSNFTLQRQPSTSELFMPFMRSTSINGGNGSVYGPGPGMAVSAAPGQGRPDDGLSAMAAAASAMQNSGAQGGGGGPRGAVQQAPALQPIGTSALHNGNESTESEEDYDSEDDDDDAEEERPQSSSKRRKGT